MAGFFEIALLVVLANVVLSIAVARYGAAKGFPFLPLLTASVFIGFPLVLLAAALMPPRSGLDRR